MFSTFLGGSGSDRGNGIALDSTGAIYVCGSTHSADFPVTAGFTFFGSDTSDDAFVTKLSPSGASLVYSRHYGGSGDDEAFGIAVDSTGEAYIVGQTSSPDFPLENGDDGTLGGARDAFIAKFNRYGTDAPYSTYLGWLRLS